MQRLNVIHWGMRELWQTSVRVPLNNPAVKILEVGCGSGIWAKEVAEVLPRAQIIGVDLSPTLLPEEPGRRLPQNLSFEVLVFNNAINIKVDDINFGLQYPEASFDMVTSRFIAGGITDWFGTIREMFRVLTGTGTSWAQLTELRPGLRCDDNSLPSNAASVTWTNIFFTQGGIGDTLGTSRFDEAAIMLKRRLEAAGFVDVHEYIDKAPVGNWHPGKSL
jgi:SAM-dependent methyltransferase